MGKILDIRDRLGKIQAINALNAKEVQETQPAEPEKPQSPPLDMTARREAALMEDRRKVRRTILTEFISVHAVVPGLGLMKVALYNINDKGVAFDLEPARGSFRQDEEIPLRVYLNHQTYFPFVVKIKHITDVNDEGVVRHGCEFVQGTINDVALQHFVAFLESVSAALRNDRGDVLVSGIKA